MDNLTHTVLVFTHVSGGLGDVASAAKIINLLVDNHTNIDVYWVLDCNDRKLHYGLSMLSKSAHSLLKSARTWFMPNPNPNLVIDVVIQTPCLHGWTLGYIGAKLKMPLEHCRVLRIAEAGTMLYDAKRPRSEPFITLGLSPAHGILFTATPVWSLDAMQDVRLAQDIQNVIDHATGSISLNLILLEMFKTFLDITTNFSHFFMTLYGKMGGKLPYRV